MSEELVKVRIRARQEVAYDQVRLIRKSLYDQYTDAVACGMDDDEFHRLAELIIDPSDIADADDFEDVEIDLTPSASSSPQL